MISGCRGSLEERFWDKVNRVDSSCWDWLGARGPNGYGHFSPRDQKVEYAHRVAFTEIYGRELPEGWEVDHICRNRQCVRDQHLQAVPPGFNRRQGREAQTARKAARTHCDKCGDALRRTRAGKPWCNGCRRRKAATDQTPGDPRVDVFGLLESTDITTMLPKAKAARGD